MQTNKKKNNKLKLIICSALAFIVGAFTLATLPQRNYVVLAEELPSEQQEEVVENTVRSVNNDLLDFAYQGIESGELAVYDYFSDNFVFDTDLVLVNFHSNSLSNGRKVLKFTLYNYYFLNGVLKTQPNGFYNSLTTNGTSSNSNYYHYFSLSSFAPTSFNDTGTGYNYTAFDYDFLLSRDVSVFWSEDGYTGVNGSIFRFRSDVLNLFQLEDTGYDITGLNLTSTYGFSAYSESGSSFGFNANESSREEIYSLLDIEFVKLSDLLVYVYNQGYDLGLEDGYNDGYDEGYGQGENAGYVEGVQSTDFYKYGVFSDCTYDITITYENVFDYEEPVKYYTLTNVSPIFRNGFLVFTNLSDYSEVNFGRDDDIDLSGTAWSWMFAEVTFNFNYELYYDFPYFYFYGDFYDDFRFNLTTLQGIDYNNFAVGRSSDLRIEVPSITGFVRSFIFNGNDYERSFRYIKIKDFSGSTTTGYENGYTAGYNEGNRVGKDEGFSLGYDSGFSAGEKQGYADGVTEGGSVFQNLISSAIDVPLKTFYGLFDIDIFGLNLSAFLLSLFSICMIVALIRFFV